MFVINLAKGINRFPNEVVYTIEEILTFDWIGGDKQQAKRFYHLQMDVIDRKIELSAYAGEDEDVYEWLYNNADLEEYTVNGIDLEACLIWIDGCDYALELHRCAFQQKR